MRKYKVLFCGLGGIGQRHLRNLIDLYSDNIEIHAFRVRRNNLKLKDDLTIDTDGNLEKDFNIIVHNQIESAILEKPDIAFITNPSSLHINVAIKLASSNVHLFIEKPLSDKLEGIDQLVKIVNFNKLICMIGYNYRFHPGLIYIKKLIDANSIGNIINAQMEVGEYLPGWHKYENFREMYASRKDLGGGVILSQIHELDIIYWFFGLPIEVFTIGGSLSNLGLDVEDSVISIFKCKSKENTFPLSLTQDYIQNPASRKMKFVGDKGLITFDLITNKLNVYDEKGELINTEGFVGFTRNDMFRNQIQTFFKAINHEAEIPVSLEDGVISLIMALAQKHSMFSNSIVSFKYFNDGVFLE